MCARLSCVHMRTFGCHFFSYPSCSVIWFRTTFLTPFRVTAVVVYIFVMRTHTIHSLFFFSLFDVCFLSASLLLLLFAFFLRSPLSFSSVGIIFPKSPDNLSVIRFIFKIQENAFDVCVCVCVRDEGLSVFFLFLLQCTQSMKKTMVGI